MAASQRTLACAIATVSNPIGVGIGFVLPPLLTDNPADIPIVLMVEACIVSLCSVPILFCPSKPPHPPAPGSRGENSKMPFSQTVRELLVNYNFWLLFVEFGLGLGAFNTLATIINQLTTPFGYDDTQSGILGFLVVFCGIIGAGVESALVDYTRRYKLFIFCTLLCSTGSLVGLTLLLERVSFIFLCFCCAALGFFMTPILPLTLELAVEVTYPVGEAMVTGLLMVSGQVVAIALVLLFDWLINQKQYHTTGWIATGLTGFSCAVMILFTGKLKRQEHEHHGTYQAINTSYE